MRSGLFRAWAHGFLACMILVGLYVIGLGINHVAMLNWPAWEPYPIVEPTVESWLHCPVGDEACVAQRHEQRQRDKAAEAATPAPSP
jgi:hypothetical protein